ncbi:MAG: glycosyltransferase family 2 protein [Planctomycetota bacterium]
MTDPLPLVSVVIPCRNEGKWIGPCLESILANDYPQERLEILVADGMSNDGTRAVLEGYALNYPFIRMLDNPQQITPAAMNTGIKNARGEIIVRVDAHADYPRDYISSLVRLLKESGADNVGGVFVTRPGRPTTIARAIAVGLSHPFGVGDSHYRVGSTEDRWVDTVPFGCYRKDVFDRIGLFDEELVRNQDDELNLRLIKHGGRIRLSPKIVCYYYARNSLRQVWQMHYQYGYFKPLVVRKVGGVMTLRQLVPPLFVLMLAVTAFVAVLSRAVAPHPWNFVAPVVFAFIAGNYMLAIGACAAWAVGKHGLRVAAALFGVFPALHISYGIGYMRGIVAFLILRRSQSGDAKAIPISRWEELPISKSPGAFISKNVAQPIVSVIVPCRNEEKWIGPCLDSILATDYPRELLDILVVDGMSNDGTRAVLEKYLVKYPFIRMLDNPQQTTPRAMNLGIAAARGSVIVRKDAHVEYPTDYISSLVNLLEQSGADNVGGVCQTLPANDSAVAKAIAIGMSHPLGVGNSHFRIGSSEDRWVDTVPFGCYRREVFDRIGMFDEELVRNQDDELNLRLIKHGGRILLSSRIVCKYYTRDSLRKLWQMCYQYGYFKPLVVRKVGGVMTLRQLAPPLLVLSLIITALGGLLCIDFPGNQDALIAFTLIPGGYLLVIGATAAWAARKYGFAVAATLFAVFSILHISYGLGYLRGVVEFLVLRRNRKGDAKAVRMTR